MPVRLTVRSTGTPGQVLVLPEIVAVGSGSTVMNTETGAAQVPEPVGVNTYSKVPATAVLIVAGFHVPVMPFVEVAGSGGAVELRQNGPIGSKVGSTGRLITIVITAVVVQKGSVGVNVYMKLPATVVFMVEGLHVPAILLSDVVGNAGGVEFWQSGPICVKVGVTGGSITMVIVVGMAQPPASGVNV